MQKPFLFIPPHMNAPQVIEFAREVEARGFAGVMSTTGLGDNVAWSLAILDHTENIRVATSIANIYTRHPHDMASAASLIESLHPGRFILGIGVAHAPTNDSLGVTVGKPLGDTRRYVEEMRVASDGQPFPTLMLAALRKRMTALSEEISEGVIWANAAFSHMRESLKEIEDRPQDFLVGNVTRTIVTDDVDAGRQAFRESFLRYTSLPNYQNYYIEAGYEEEIRKAKSALSNGDEVAAINAVSDRMVDDLSNIGTAAQVRAKVQSWYDLGVTDLTLNPMSLSDPEQTHQEIMAAFD